MLPHAGQASGAVGPLPFARAQAVELCARTVFRLTHTAVVLSWCWNCIVCVADHAVRECSLANPIMRGLTGRTRE